MWGKSEDNQQLADYTGRMAGSSDEHSSEFAERAAAVLANNYGPAPLLFESADGPWLIAPDGERYLDFGSGISVTSFGQGHPQIKAAVTAQLDRVWHTSNLFYTEPPLRLARKLLNASFAHKVFFANSGAEANEAAIKLVRKAASQSRPPEQRQILTFNGGFHGRTLATVTATAQPKYHEGFEPLVPGFKYCTFNDIDALRRAFDDSVCAVMFEPVQGEGGIHVAKPEFVDEIKRLARQHGAYVIADEVQCGIARTGKLWAYEWYEDFEPDVLTSAKALGGGLPIGAVLIGPALQNVLQPGSHGSTFGGNPVSCAAADVVIDLASDPALLANVTALGDAVRAHLAELNEQFAVFEQIRGRGLMCGAQLLPELRPFIASLVAACRAQKLLVLQAGDGVLRLLPPLTVRSADVESMSGRLKAALETDWKR